VSVPVPRAVLRWFERQIGRTVTLLDGRKVTLRLVDACSGEISFCIEVPGSGLVWLALDELEIPAEEGRSQRATRGWPR
jgi:hypothetical protein